MNEYELIEKFKVLEIKPGDCLVGLVKGQLSSDAWKRVKQDLSAIFPGVKVLLLEEGFDLAVIRGGGE